MSATEAELEILEKYASGESIEQLKIKYNCSNTYIRTLLQRNNIHIRDRSESKSCYVFTKDGKKLKICTRCKEEKPLDDFYTQHNIVNGVRFPTLSGKCKSCTIALSIEKRLGVSEEEYNVLYLKQNGKCAICFEEETTLSNNMKTTKKLSIDHDHTTGKVRGLVCANCNSAIGLFKENADIVLSAYNYLKNGL
jgi:hypothetical protein